MDQIFSPSKFLRNCGNMSKRVYILGRPCNSLLECYSISMQTNGVTLQQTEKFNYLGDTFLSDGSYNNELDTRIKRAIALMFQFFRLVALKQDLFRTAKLSVFRSIFVHIITYGHECWIMTKIVRPEYRRPKCISYIKLRFYPYLTRYRALTFRVWSSG